MKDQSKPVWQTEQTPRIGISSCLLGNSVRYDGQHKKNDYIVHTLGPFVEWVPVCPEYELGMGIPREPVSLVNDNGTTKMIGRESGKDWTEKMNRWSKQKVKAIKKLHLSGYISKKDSPSCGLNKVKLITGKNKPQRKGRGLFAAQLQDADLYIPIEDEGRLNDTSLRENFITRIFTTQRLLELFAKKWKHHDLMQFHAKHKLLLMAYHPSSYKKLGQLVANSEKRPLKEIKSEYEQGLFLAFSKPATKNRHVNVLSHCEGYFRKCLDEAARKEIHNIISDYQNGLIPLIVPMTMIKHYARLLNIGYLLEQIYLDPHPRELMLKNHA